MASQSTWWPPQAAVFRSCKSSSNLLEWRKTKTKEFACSVTVNFAVISFNPRPIAALRPWYTSREIEEWIGVASFQTKSSQKKKKLVWGVQSSSPDGKHHQTTIGPCWWWCALEIFSGSFLLFSPSRSAASKHMESCFIVDFEVLTVYQCKGISNLFSSLSKEQKRTLLWVYQGL